LGRLKKAIRNRKLILFAQIDHSGEARRVGLTMQETQLLIFGSPKAGTPLTLPRLPLLHTGNQWSEPLSMKAVNVRRFHLWPAFPTLVASSPKEGSENGLWRTGKLRR